MPIIQFNLQKINVSWFCLLLLAQFVSPLCAQSTPVEDTVISRTLRFVFLPGGAYKELYYSSGKEWIRLEVENIGLTQKFRYTGPSMFRLYDQIPSEESPVSPVAEVDLLHSTGECLLLLIPNNASQNYIIYPIKDGRDNFPTQSSILVNLTRNELAGALDDFTGSVPPGQYGVIKFNTQDSTRLRIRIAVRERTNGDWKLVYSSTIPAREKHRRWLVVYTGDSRRTLIYPDFVQP